MLFLKYKQNNYVPEPRHCGQVSDRGWAQWAQWKCDYSLPKFGSGSVASPANIQNAPAVLTAEVVQTLNLAPDAAGNYGFLVECL